jgi:general secretion pathway protein C
MINRYFNIANIVLVTLGVFLCVKTFYAVVTPRPDYVVPLVSAAKQNSRSAATWSKPPQGNYKTIAQRNIFNSGNEDIAPVSQKVDLEKLKQTELKLKLWGTVTGQKERAYAVIEDTKTRQQNLYHAGDNIQNAVVKLILREKVVLNVDDRDEILAMEEIRGRRGGQNNGTRLNRCWTKKAARFSLSAQNQTKRRSNSKGHGKPGPAYGAGQSAAAH